jgi:hypothetical protein
VGTKAGVHIGGKEVDPDTRGFEPDVDLLDNMEAYMAKTMPGARTPPRWLALAVVTQLTHHARTLHT